MHWLKRGDSLRLRHHVKAALKQEPISEATTGSWADPRGSFRIEAVPAGNYTLTVGAEVPGKRTLGKVASQPISVAEGRESQATIGLDLAEIAPVP